MQYYDEIITIESLMEETRAYQNSSPQNAENITQKKLRQEQKDSDLNSNFELYLTTKEACNFLRCSKSTIWNYVRAGLLKPLQWKKRGLTRWRISDLQRIFS
jgi:excisionase family DNA binding protein